MTISKKPDVSTPGFFLQALKQLLFCYFIIKDLGLNYFPVQGNKYFGGIKKVT